MKNNDSIMKLVVPAKKLDGAYNKLEDIIEFLPDVNFLRCYTQECTDFGTEPLML
jgi:hypothetical protein